MEDDDLIENIILNENAYFYIKDNDRFITKRDINEAFKDASREKQGHFLLNVVKEPYKIIDGKDIFYSIAVFKYYRKPTFIEEEIAGWEEIKLAYICILDFENHVVIAKKNISGIKDFLDKFDPMDYNVITSIFTGDETIFEKATMNNMNIANNAIRQKSLESTDLKENLPALGLQGYILNNVRVNNDDDKISLSVNSSRINKFGSKNNFETFIKWSDKIVDRIINYVPRTSFLSSFATSVDYVKYKDQLFPISILIVLSKLYSDFEENKIERCFVKIKNQEREINLIKVVKNFERLLSVNIEANGYKIQSTIINDLYLSLNLKSITLKSTKLANVYIQFENDSKTPILQYLNWNKSFIITFDDPELVYCNRKLFKDSRLLGNIDAFMKIFIPFNELRTVTSEKGTFNSSSTKFSSNSIFDFVENNYSNDFDYFICDDLGREWADHIGLSDQSISFFHSKYNNSIMSASDLHEIIGQAQKNLGNLSPSDNQWPLKESFWAKNYISSKGIQTNIKRIRKGSNSADTIDYFKTLRSYANLKKRVYVVINFISKAELADRLEKLKDGEDFAERNEVIQILWFVSSLISSCFESGSEIYICCKP
ncbi:hypothetical protein IRZ71_04735 [Flavobacterium sp. ANB]|uniref:hypothetical protein n=1 Tax=unclassified Flavobacterium TaxID=196869 RepID=UPI0012B964C9|nr:MULTISPECIES: hypothetical protein [unclassified Flavobacterium]MBF4515634.1 hypothetical protein [Flavobacterium sp. ANB]MTD68637.1 hypothetical protein [Flavobacterium sp. LC2016-13]